MEADILDFLRRHAIVCRETDTVVSVMPEADAVYMIRIQDEHDTVRGIRDPWI